jgi:hypothetical protein
MTSKQNSKTRYSSDGWMDGRVPGEFIVTEFFSARKMSAKIVQYVQKSYS